MARITITMDSKTEKEVRELAKSFDMTLAQIMRKGLVMYKTLHEQEEQGYNQVMVANQEGKERLLIRV